MNRVLESRKISPQTVTSIGIAVHEDGGHIGLIYRTSENEPVRLLHLGWHNKLRSHLVSSDYVCWIRPGIATDRADAIATLCRRIWKRNQEGKVPYGLSRPGQFFDTGGNLLLGPAKVGLTCASFVLEVFDRAGFPLVKYETWPAADAGDLERQRMALRDLDRNLEVDRAHVAAFAREVGNIRYRPLEVAGAGTADVHPTDHDFATAIAVQIDAMLRQIRAA